MESTGFCIFDENMNPVLIDSIPTIKTQSHGKRLKVIALKEDLVDLICLRRLYIEFMEFVI